MAQKTSNWLYLNSIIKLYQLYVYIYIISYHNYLYLSIIVSFIHRFSWWTLIFHGETLFKLPFCWLVCGISILLALRAPPGNLRLEVLDLLLARKPNAEPCWIQTEMTIFFWKTKIMMRFLETYFIHSRNLWNVQVVFGLNQSLPKFQDIPSTSSSHSNLEKHPSMFILLSGLPSYWPGAVRTDLTGPAIQDGAKGPGPVLTGPLAPAVHTAIARFLRSLALSPDPWATDKRPHDTFGHYYHFKVP